MLLTVVQVFLTFVKMITKNFASGTCKLLIEALRFVVALLDFTLYSSKLPFYTHLRHLDLYLDSHRTISNVHGSPFIVATYMFSARGA